MKNIRNIFYKKKIQSKVNIVFILKHLAAHELPGDQWKKRTKDPITHMTCLGVRGNGKLTGPHKD